MPHSGWMYQFVLEALKLQIQKGITYSPIAVWLNTLTTQSLVDEELQSRQLLSLQLRSWMYYVYGYIHCVVLLVVIYVRRRAHPPNKILCHFTPPTECGRNECWLIKCIHKRWIPGSFFFPSPLRAWVQGYHDQMRDTWPWTKADNSSRSVTIMAWCGTPNLGQEPELKIAPPATIAVWITIILLGSDKCQTTWSAIALTCSAMHNILVYTSLE